MPAAYCIIGCSRGGLNDRQWDSSDRKCATTLCMFLLIACCFSVIHWRDPKYLSFWHRGDVACAMIVLLFSAWHLTGLGKAPANPHLPLRIPLLLAVTTVVFFVCAKAAHTMERWMSQISCHMVFRSAAWMFVSLMCVPVEWIHVYITGVAACLVHSAYAFWWAGLKPQFECQSNFVRGCSESVLVIAAILVCQAQLYN